MASEHLDRSAGRSLRLWPGVVLAAALAVFGLVVPAVGALLGTPLGILGLFGAIACGVAIIVWWLFFSRAPWSERLAGIGFMVVAVLATWPLVDESVANGFMSRMLLLFAVPLMSFALVAGVAAGRHLPAGRRYAVTGLAILLGCGVMTLVRTGGISGDAESDLHWRWTPTPEDRLLAQAPSEPAPVALASPAELRRDETPAPVAPTPGAPASALANPVELRRGEPAAPEWPGFRGPNRDSTLHGVLIEANWSQTPPVELWRRPIGPGWSSFAVSGDLFYTQEQRGEDEIVSAYRLSTGEPVWRHKDPVRFYESNGGPGPRATPTLHNGRAYTMGATGLVNALDAATGALIWTHNAAADTGKTVPDWGVASSPLVVDDLVVVAVSGQLAAYDERTGEPRWIGQPGGAGYSSPHLATIAGVPQILLLRGSRTISVSPGDGTLLWDYVSGPPATSIVQPAVSADDAILIATGDAMGGNGILRVAVAHGPDGWKVEERWTSRGLKPYFNDFVVHEGHVFGFDGSILSCIDLADGSRKWKGGRFGHGQLVLLPEQDLLLVLSEDGELALVSATAEKFTEIARLPALEGKTWNHPVVVGDTLLVRNGEEMAAYRLARPSVGLQ